MATQEVIAGEESRLLSEVRDRIGWITFNNPARHNAMSKDMWTVRRRCWINTPPTARFAPSC